MISLVLVLFAVAPHSTIAEQSVSMIEVNHFYDEHGKHVLDQLLFWDWSKGRSRYELRAWRLLNRQRQKPYRCNGRWVCCWFDGDELRRITADHVRETWTQFDPECEARSVQAKELRPDLLRTIPRRQPSATAP